MYGSFLLLCGALFFSILGSDPDQYSLFEIAYFLCAAVIVAIVQVLCVRGIGVGLGSVLTKINSRNIESIILTGATIANAHYFCFAMVHLGRPPKAAIELGIGILFFLVAHDRVPKKMANVFMLAFIGVSLASISAWQWSVYQDDTAWRTSSSVQMVGDHEIADKKNIYVIIPDGLTGRKSLSAFFDLPDPPYWHHLERKGFRVMDAISAGSHTTASFSRMLSNSKDMPNVTHIQSSVISGVGAVPTYDVLESNGYKVQLVTSSTYVGYDIGRFEYFVPKKYFFRPGTCDFVSHLYLYIACSYRLAQTLNVITQWGMNTIGVVRYGRDRAILDGATNPKGLDEVISIARHRIDVAARSPGPWFTFVHLGIPGHAPTGGLYSYSNVRQREGFVKEYRLSLMQMTDMLDDFVEDIRRRDPTGLIIITGDHGSWVTKDAGGTDYRGSGSHPMTLLDRFNVTLAVSPNDFCSDLLVEDSLNFHLIRSIIQCLSLERDPFNQLSLRTDVPTDVGEASKFIEQLRREN